MCTSSQWLCQFGSISALVWDLLVMPIYNHRLGQAAAWKSAPCHPHLYVALQLGCRSAAALHIVPGCLQSDGLQILIFLMVFEDMGILGSLAADTMVLQRQMKYVLAPCTFSLLTLWLTLKSVSEQRYWSSTDWRIVWARVSQACT